jgi:hypothetical protein
MLDNAGFEARHIMRTSGHKSESSIRSYSYRLTDKKKREIAGTLAESAGLKSDDAGLSSHPSAILQPAFASAAPGPSSLPAAILQPAVTGNSSYIYICFLHACVKSLLCSFYIDYYIYIIYFVILYKTGI